MYVHCCVVRYIRCSAPTSSCYNCFVYSNHTTMTGKDTLPSNLDIMNVLKNSNLTPSQKVSVITELNNKNQPSKNLSHVPCKFFRQGACQAGNSCPFSHAMGVAVDSQPCKYFQKGNCKFGIKCALAHVLPDGTKVNAKSVQTDLHCAADQHPSAHRSPANFSYAEPLNSTYMAEDGGPESYNSYRGTAIPYDELQPLTDGAGSLALGNTPYDKNALAGGHSYNYNHNYMYNGEYSYEYDSKNTTKFISTPTSPEASLVPAASSSSTLATSPFNSASIWSATAPATLNNTNSGQIRSLSFSHPASFGKMNTFTPIPSANSVALTSPSQAIFSLPSLSSSASKPGTEHAVLDSDEDDMNNMTNASSSNGEDAEDVDYIPSSLNDLLTPQELSRRKSRSSFGSQNNAFTLSLMRDTIASIEQDTPFIMD